MKRNQFSTLLLLCTVWLGYNSKCLHIQYTTVNLRWQQVVYHDSSLSVQLYKSLTSFGTSSFKTWTPMLLFWTSYITTSLLKVTRGQSQ